MDINKLKLTPDSNIKGALKIIGQERVRLDIIVDKEDKFLGVISDSNIRKALINGKALKDSIKDIYTKNPITIKENTNKEQLLRIPVRTDVYDSPVSDEKGQILSIESVSSLLKTNLNSTAVMAGGLGSRLKELIKDTPKPMLKVGKKPILESIIQRLKNQNFENFVFCVNYKKQIIEDYFQKGQKFGVKISYIKERKKLGTAGALGLIKQEFKESFIVMNADILAELGLNDLLKAHKKSRALMSVCVREFEQRIPYGVIAQEQGFIENIEEKPTQKSLVNAGIYVLENEILNLVAKNKYLDMPELIKLAPQKGKANIYIINGYWIDIGGPDEFLEANEDFK